MKKNIFILDDDFECYKTIYKILKYYFSNFSVYPDENSYENFIINAENKDYDSLLMETQKIGIDIYIIDIKFGNNNYPSGIKFLEHIENKLPPTKNNYEYILITDGGYEENNLKKYGKKIPFISKSNLGNRATALLIKEEIKKILKQNH